MTTLDYQHPRGKISSSRAPAILAWIVILFVSIALPLLNHFNKESAAPVDGVDATFQLQGQYSLGAARAFPQNKDQITQQLIDTASNPLKKVAAGILRDVTNQQSPDVDPLLLDSLGRHYPWFLRLTDAGTQAAALAEADRTFRIVVILVTSLLFVMALGLTLGILAIILRATGLLLFRTQPPVAPAGIYVEAFALWLVLFVIGSVLSTLLLENVPLVVRMAPMGAVVAIAAIWPLLRGVPAAIYRKDIGLHAGAGFFREIFSGIIGYIACLPLIGIAMLIVIGLSFFTHQTTSHPIVDQISGTHPIWLYLLAAVFAPVTEELMFRGLLLSHLRRHFGIVLSGLINGLIFAAIHPQGWLAIPALWIIAFNLSLIRQWRDSLIGPMIAHGLHNAALVTIMIIIFR